MKAFTNFKWGSLWSPLKCEGVSSVLEGESCSHWYLVELLKEWDGGLAMWTIFPSLYFEKPCSPLRCKLSKKLSTNHLHPACEIFIQRLVKSVRTPLLVLTSFEKTKLSTFIIIIRVKKCTSWWIPKLCSIFGTRVMAGGGVGGVSPKFYT